MDEINTLSNHFLVSVPSMQDPFFTKSVIYICENHPEGSVGLMINHPMNISWDFVFKELKITPMHAQKPKQPLLLGGPMQPERGFVIHRPTGKWRTSLLLLPNEVTITTSNDIIRAIAAENAPEEMLVTLGFVTWKGNQLEEEIKQGCWLVCPYDRDLMYHIDFEKRWDYAAALLKVDLMQLVSGGGHA